MGKALLISKALICNYLQMGISRCGLRKMTTGNVFLPWHSFLSPAPLDPH